jgi:GxxExxY protein
MNKINEITQNIIGAAIEIHRAIGPGLLESSYELCLEKEFKLREIPYQRQLKIPLSYKGLELDYTYRIDFLVANRVVVEVKAVDILMPVHHAQLLSYLKLGNWKTGLLINFHVPVLSMGIKRIVWGFDR